jgi:hypothetical protein
MVVLVVVTGLQSITKIGQLTAAPSLKVGAGGDIGHTILLRKLQIMQAVFRSTAMVW